MKKIFTCIFCAVLALPVLGEIVVEPTNGTTAVGHTQTPIVISDANYNYISQQIYLASELGGTTNKGDITSIQFHNKTAVTLTDARTIKVYINTTLVNAFSGTFIDKGTEVYSTSDFNLPASESWYTIPFSKPFKWDGTSNIVITVFDNTDKRTAISSKSHYSYKSEGAYRAIFKKGGSNDLMPENFEGLEGTNIEYYAAAKFTIDDSSPSYDAPTNVSATTTSSTATISWTKKDEAKIKLQYSQKAADDWKTVNDIDAASYTITGLSAETEYEYNVSAVYEGGESSAVYDFFTTASIGHEHDGIAFLGWEETTALPAKAGSYFLKNNVTVNKWTLPDGDTKICLNGKTITITGTGTFDCTTINSGESLSIYDNEGNGKITAGLNFAATIKVNGGTLSLYGGTIENTATAESASAVHVASSTSTFNLKGDVKMSTSSNAANINLQYGKITLIGAITNATKLSVQKSANVDITSGWSTYMESANPADFFVSANKNAPAVILADGEAQLGMPSFEFSETGEYTSYPSGKTDVNLVRTFQGGILNTISLPFALTDAQMKEAFGEDYELYQLSSSALSNNVLEVYFDKVTNLALGYPYLLRVSEDIVNPSFSSVTLGTASHRTSTTAVDMVSVVKAQEVAGSDYNLFLNAAGELNWSTQDALFKGMRAYFQVKEGYRNAVAARQLIIRNTPTDMKSIATHQMVEKTFEKGRLFILKNGKKHTMQGQIVK